MTEERSMSGFSRYNSITTRLAATIALILVGGGIVVTLAALEYGRQAAEEAFDRLLAGAAFQISRAVTIDQGEIIVDLPVSAFELLALAPDDRVAYRVVDEAGETVTGNEHIVVPAPNRAGTVYFTQVLGGSPHRLVAMRRQFAERAYIGDVTIVVGHTVNARAELAWDIAQNALILAVAAGLVLIALTVFAVRSALSPLRRIENALLARDPKDLSPLAVSAPREVKTMISAIDRFMSRLSRRVTSMQNLIADAAHQLRTPVSALRAQAELAAEEDDPQKLRNIARRIHERAVGLSRLTDQMLNQALVIHRSDAETRTLIDLRTVAVQASEQTDQEIFAASDELHLDLPEEPIHVYADSLSLVEATKNLLNNAFKYGTVPVSLIVRNGQCAELVVCDHGEGISEEDWVDSGRRFARSAGSSPGSAGLGLAIVNAVAEAHDGRLVFSKTEDGGFAASLQLPTDRDQ